jgi:hypothetical protein
MIGAVEAIGFIDSAGWVKDSIHEAVAAHGGSRFFMDRPF